eukprot:TRINITY_DN3655_c0_g1_i1.p1 TRINITY_DN3655_c0_g1~~TRINITY_DN3655_c0_g1_i1.p1  ORF type:complete len:253 (-),score=40.62 TRINITY_DN3655_c0_g1_i1:42-800(-)
MDQRIITRLSSPVVSITVLRDCLKAIGSTVSDTLNRTELISQTMLDITELGIEEICRCFGDTTLKMISSSPTAISNRNDLLMHTEIAIKLKGLNNFLLQCSESLLDAMLKDLGFNEPVVSQKVQVLKDEVLLTGLEAFFLLLTTALQKKFASVLKVKVTGRKQDMAEQLVSAFVQESAESESDDDMEGIEVKPAVTKAALDRKTVKELRQQLGDLGLSTEGLKAVLVKRLLAHYEDKAELSQVERDISSITS